MIDASIISFCVKYNALNTLQQAGVEESDFLDEWQLVWKYIVRMKRTHDTVPSADTLLLRFPDIELPDVRRSELALLLDSLRRRKKFIDFMGILNDAASSGVDYESVDDVIESVQGRLNTLAFRNTGRNHLVDIFGKATRDAIAAEVEKRRSGKIIGIPTGLKRFDKISGGLQKQKMVVAMGRTGAGKSWIDLLFAARAVLDGKSVIIYPLEMTLFETAARLLTIFSQLMPNHPVVKNLDIVNGKTSPAKLRKFMRHLEEKFSGQLFVADVGSLADIYTIERIEAEVEVHKPDMFWVDYITLLKMPAGTRNDGDYIAVRKLSNGIKNIAMRRNCVGGCSAQVNRVGAGKRMTNPDTEHISYGDSIGQDADIIFSLWRKSKTDPYLWYSLPKNRGGPEFGRTRVSFLPNEGVLEEDNWHETAEGAAYQRDQD